MSLVILFKIRQDDKNAFIVTVKRSDHKITLQVIHSKKLSMNINIINKQANKQTVTFNYNATIIIV